MTALRRRLLLVEDDRDLSSAIVDALMDAGFDVLHAENGKTALQTLRDESELDVIVLDLMMPEMNGWQFRAAQKADPHLMSTPVIVMSANDSAHARAIDADFHLWKPFPLQSLVGAVERAIALRDRRRAATSRAHADRLAAVRTLAAGIAHEINNPLTGLLGNLDQARKLVDADGEVDLQKVSSYLRNVHEAGLQIARVVKDTSTLAAGDTGHLPLDIKPIVESAVSMLSTQTKEAARVETAHDAAPRVRGSPAKLLQVVLNLLMNAIQARRPDANCVIHAKTFTADSGEAVIEISDNGCGIPADLLATIFEPFFTTKEPGQGTGLGLSISHEIVSAMGGHIAVESALDKGSTFRVYLPSAGATVSGLHRIDSTMRNEFDEMKVKLRILVVEDDEIVANAMRLLLANHDVVVEQELRGARERVLSGETYDTVLCDLNLPDGSGAELHIAITQYRPELADRFILMTGGVRRRADAEFVKSLGSRALSKPFEQGTLENAIREVTSAASISKILADIQLAGRIGRGSPGSDSPPDDA